MNRVIGTEVEYGISTPKDPSLNPILLSTQIVLAYASAAVSYENNRIRWDYEEESPFRDARNQEFTKSHNRPFSIDVDSLSAPNVILTNGARLYVDHAHPEYSTPEVADSLEAALWDKAGERIMERAAIFAATIPGSAPIQLYKNNIDGKGASYGTHENYLMNRSTPFENVISGLIPFFVSRQVFTGSGRVGRGQRCEEVGFQLSQRADYIEVEVGLETTLKRGIINTRDEPHSDIDKYRRLHVIVGDANLSEIATYLKLGTTSLVLDLIEEFAKGNLDKKFDLSSLQLKDPVKAIKVISYDYSLKNTVELVDGRSLTGLQLQYEYLEKISAYLLLKGIEQKEKDILDLWKSTLDDLSQDPMLCADYLDWPAKLRILEGFKQREGLGWSSPRLQLIDLQYSDVRLDKGLYNKLVSRGSMKRLFTESQIENAITNSPESTRAYFRGECLKRFGENIAAVNWDSIIFDIGEPKLVKIPMLEPLKGTKEHVGSLLDSCNNVNDLVKKLTS